MNVDIAEGVLEQLGRFYLVIGGGHGDQRAVHKVRSDLPFPMPGDIVLTVTEWSVPPVRDLPTPNHLPHTKTPTGTITPPPFLALP